MDADDLIRRCRSARNNHSGRPYGGWSTREQLAVALVLGDEETLKEFSLDALEAVQYVRDGMANPPPDMVAWLTGLRRIVDTTGLEPGSTR